MRRSLAYFSKAPSLVMLVALVGMAVTPDVLARPPAKAKSRDEGRIFRNQRAICPRYFFTTAKKQAGLDVPLCPSETGLVMLPSIYPPASVFLGFSQTPVHVALLEKVIEASGRQKPPPAVNVLIPRQETDAAYAMLKKYLDDPYADFVNFVATPSDETLWAQDYFEVAVSMSTGKGSVIDLPYTDREGEVIPSSIALSCHMNLIAQGSFDPKSGEEPGNGDYGGNIEAFPGGVVAIGNNMTRATRRVLEEHLTHQELVTLDVGWLETGHVDEIVTALPKRGDDGPCNFVLAYGSPARAMELLKQNPYRPGRDLIEPPIPDEAKADGEPAPEDFSECYQRVAGRAKTPVKRRHGDDHCRHFWDANQTYEKLNAKSAALLRQRIENRSACKKVELIALPQLYAPESRRPVYGSEADFARAVNPNVTNAISLGATVIMSEQPYGPFKRAIARALAVTKLDTLFLDSRFVHHLRGGVHCASNVVRACRPKPGLGPTRSKARPSGNSIPKRR